jgi:hypothetical protein
MLKFARSIGREAGPEVVFDVYTPVAARWANPDGAFPRYWFTGDQDRSKAEIALHPETGQVLRFALVFADDDLWRLEGGSLREQGTEHGIPCFDPAALPPADAGRTTVVQPGPVSVALHPDAVTIEFGERRVDASRVVRSGRVEFGVLPTGELAWVRVRDLAREERDVLAAHARPPESDRVRAVEGSNPPER